MGQDTFETPIRLRGHHLAGIIENSEAMEKDENWEEDLRQGLVSMGYGPDATDTYIGITNYLRQHPEAGFLVMEDLGRVCEGCEAAERCRGLPEILLKDTDCLARLGLEAGKLYSGKDLVERMHALDNDA